MPKENGEWAALKLHRLLHPEWKLCDHENGIGTDNRRFNLREASGSQNNANSRKRKDGVTSRFRGVCWNKHTKKFRASIRINRNSHYLGHFTDERQAAVAYDMAALSLFGEFARLNFPAVPVRLPVAA